MKKFMLIHVGFEKPTPEIMNAWKTWFESIAPRQVAQGGFENSVELSKSERKELSWDLNALTGYNIIEAENLEAAEKLAQSNPFVTSIRIYELR